MATSVGQGGVFDKLIAHRERLTGRQAAMARAAPEEQREFLEAQFKLQNESEATEMLTRLLKEDGRMAVLRNI